MLNPDIVSGRDINGEIRLDIAKELGINKGVVDEVCKACWEYTSNMMPLLIPVRFQYLGVFNVKKKRLEHLGWSKPTKEEYENFDKTLKISLYTKQKINEKITRKD